MRFHVRYEVLVEEQDGLRSYEPPNLHLWKIQKKTEKGKKSRVYQGTLGRKDFDKFVRHCGLIALYALKDSPARVNKPISRIAFSNLCTNQVVAMVDVSMTQHPYTNLLKDTIERIVKLVDATLRVYGGKK